jgi:hypothetical protein
MAQLMEQPPVYGTAFITVLQVRCMKRVMDNLGITMATAITLPSGDSITATYIGVWTGLQLITHTDVKLMYQLQAHMQSHPQHMRG